MTNASSSTNSPTMTFDSQLIEDFLHTDDILINELSATPLSVFMNNDGESEALVIGKNSLGNNELYHVCREPLSDSGWNIYGMGAYAASIAVADSNMLWAVGTDQQIWQNVNGRWSQQAPALPGGATLMPLNPTNSAYIPLSVGTDSTVWAVDSSGNLYQYNADANEGKGEWEPVAGISQLSQAPSGNAQTFLAISGGEIIWYGDEGSVGTPLPDGASPRQVSVGVDASHWAIDQNGKLYQYAAPNSSGGWQQVAGAPTLYMFAVVVANNIWGITSKDSSFALEHYDGQAWQLVSQAPPLGTQDSSQSALPIPYAQLSIANNGTVWCVDTNGVAWKYVTSRGPSWQRQMMPTGMSGFTSGTTYTGNVVEAVVGQDGHGQQAFYIANPNWLFQASLTTGGTWRLVGSVYIGCSGLGITNQQDNGELIVYCVNSSGNLIVVSSSSSGSYEHATFDAHGLLKGAKLQINAMNAGAWFTVAIIGEALHVQWGDASNPLSYNNTSYLYLVSNTPHLKEFVRLPWLEAMNAGFYCSVLDTSGNIYMVFNIVPSVNIFENSVECQASFVPLTGNQAALQSPVTSTGALIDAHGWSRIYATDDSGKLWVIRQTSCNGGDQNNPWTWTAWHPLGDDCLYMANGPGTRATHELFTINADSFLKHLWQDPVNLNWDSSLLRKPAGVSDEPYYVSQYVTEITVLDAGGNPEPNVAVTVSAPEPVSVWVNGVQHSLDSTHTATFSTNPMGKITLSTLALSLHTAQLSFQAEGFANTYTVYPPQNIQNRLSGVDGPALASAQARTQSVPTPVNPPLVSNQSDCGPAATVIQGVFKIKSQNNINPGAPTGVSAQATTPPTYEAVRALWAAKVVDVRPLATSTAGAPEESGIWVSFWNSLKDFGEDIWHAVRKGVLAVEHIVVDIEQGIITVTLALTNDIKAAISFVIKTIDDVVHAVAAAFRWLGAEIEKVIDWLKAFFDWGDIINTKTVIEHYINQVFTNLIADVNPNSPNNVQQLFKAQFQKMIDLVKGDSNQPGSDAFSQARKAFGSSTFNSSVSNIPVHPSVGRNALQPDGVQNTYGAHQVRCNYAHRKTEDYIHQGGTVMPSSGGAATLTTGSGSFDDFLNLITKNLDLNNPQSKYSKAQADFQTKLQGIHPKGLFDTGVSDFLDLVKDFVLVVLELVEEIVLALLNLAGEGLTAFQAMLNHVLHIPVISWLYEKISGHPFTLLDLFCLVMAIPATLIYKLIWGGAEASPPFTTAQVQTINGKPIPWPQIQGTGLGFSPPLQGALGAEGVVPPALPIVFGVLSLLNALLYGFVDMATDIEAVNGPGESGYPLTTFLSVLALLLSVANAGYSSPYEVFVKPPDKRTTADLLYVALWAWSLPFIALNVVSIVASKKDCLAKYLEVRGPVAVSLFGLLQFAVGVYSTVEFAKAGSEYNAAYSASAIITPIPSMGKLLLLPKSEEPLLVLVPLDLICDFGSGACSFAEALT